MLRTTKARNACLRIGLLISTILALTVTPIIGPTASADDPALQKRAAIALESLGLQPFPKLKDTWMMGDEDHPYQATLIVSDNPASADIQFSRYRFDTFRAVSWSPQEEVDLGLGKPAYVANFSMSGLAGNRPGKRAATGEADGVLLCGNVVLTTRHWVTTYHDATPVTVATEASKGLAKQAHAELKSWLPKLVQSLIAKEVCGSSDRLPIIFIPGVAGSKLYKDSTLGPGQLWAFAPTSSRVHLALAPDGSTSQTGANIVVGDIFRETGIDLFGALDFYGGLVKFLEKKGWKEKRDLEVFPYDWRQDNRKHIDALDHMVNAIRTRTGKQKVIIIAHSMGGVIARDYVYSNAPRASKVDSIITMGTPYWGAPKVFYAMISGYTFGNPFVRKPLMKILVQNMPAAYQLMPWIPFIQDSTTSQFLTLEESYKDIRFKFFTKVWENAIMDSYTESKENDWSLNKALIDSAASFRASVGTKQDPKPLPANVKQYAIVGFGVRTLGHFEMKDWESGLISRFLGWAPGFRAWRSYLELANGRKIVLQPRFQDGDGTVPKWGLETSTATATYYVPYKKDDSTAHGDLPNSKRVQELVGQILENKPPDPNRYQHTFVNDLIDLEGIDFTLHSDATLRIVDESGGTLGVNDKGEIDETLPTGTFIEVDGVEYGSIADLSRPYTVEVTGIREGKFTLMVDIEKRGGVTTFYYPEVAVKEGTVAQFKLTPEKVTTSFPELQVSTDGKTSRVAAQVPPPDARLAAKPSSQSSVQPAAKAVTQSPVQTAVTGSGAAAGSSFPLLPALLGAALVILLPVGVVLVRRRRPAAIAQREKRHIAEEQIPVAVQSSTSTPSGAVEGDGAGKPLLAPIPEPAGQTKQDAPHANVPDGVGADETKPAVRAVSRPKFCIKCGARIGSSRKFCIMCGYNIDD